MCVCLFNTSYKTFILPLADRNNSHDPAVLTCGSCHDKLTWLVWSTWASQLRGVTDGHYFWMESSNFPCLCPLFSLLLSHLIWCPCSQRMFNPVLNTHHYSSILSLSHSLSSVCASHPNRRMRRFKVTERTGGQSILCQQWQIVMFDDKNKVK